MGDPLAGLRSQADVIRSGDCDLAGPLGLF
jgi:hypothetical protein